MKRQLIRPGPRSRSLHPCPTPAAGCWYASSLAGADIDFDDEPIKQYITNTFGLSGVLQVRTPHVEHNARAIKAQGVKVRLLVGDGDWLYGKDGKKITENFSKLLTQYGIQTPTPFSPASTT